MFTFDNSLAKGRKMTNDLGQADAPRVQRRSRQLRSVAARRKRRSPRRSASTRRSPAIAKLGNDDGDAHQSKRSIALRVEELELTADYLMKVTGGTRKRPGRNGERLREERKVEAELAAERERLDKERSHLVNALKALEASRNRRSRAIEAQARQARRGHRAQRLPSRQHQGRLRVRHLQPRGVR